MPMKKTTTIQLEQSTKDDLTLLKARIAETMTYEEFIKVLIRIYRVATEETKAKLTK